MLYISVNDGNGTTKEYLTVTKNGNLYKIEYSLLSGLYEVDLDTIPKGYIEKEYW